MSIPAGRIMTMEDTKDVRLLLQERGELLAEKARLRKALDAASGYLMNAKIDLETGCTKRTAIGTIDGGLKMIREAVGEPVTA